MRSIILKFIILVCFAWLSLLVLDKFFFFGIKNNLNLKSSYVQKQKIDAEILIHGPCEPLWMLSPQRITRLTGKSCYNLALSHSDFADNFLHLYLYLKSNKAPKLLLLYVTPESFDLNYNTFNSYRFSAWLGNPILDKVVEENDPDYFRFSTVPYLRFAYYNQKINFEAIQGYKHYFSNKRWPYFKDGFEPPGKIRWDNHFRDFLALHPDGYNFQWNSNREKYFRKIIELTKEKNIPLVLYESPILKEILRFQKNRSEMLKKIKSISNEYQIDYCIFEGMKIAENKENFISPMNLKLSAALEFSDTMAIYLNKHYFKK